MEEVTLPDTESNDLTLFKFERLRMSSSLTGTLPSTSPVFPPCGTIPILFSLQCLTILLTVVRDLRIVGPSLVLPHQSSSNGVSSSAGVFDGERVDKMEERARKLEKHARPSSVTEFRWCYYTVVETHGPPVVQKTRRCLPRWCSGEIVLPSDCWEQD
jgi:hypothetical protein